MNAFHGVLIAVATLAVTLAIVAFAGLSFVIFQMEEERRGMGCRGAGCRRSRPGHGCTKAPRVAETARGDITKRD